MEEAPNGKDVIGDFVPTTIDPFVESPLANAPYTLTSTHPSRSPAHPSSRLFIRTSASPRSLEQPQVPQRRFPQLSHESCLGGCFFAYFVIRQGSREE